MREALFIQPPISHRHFFCHQSTSFSRSHPRLLQREASQLRLSRRPRQDLAPCPPANTPQTPSSPGTPQVSTRHSSYSSVRDPRRPARQTLSNGRYYPATPGVTKSICPLANMHPLHPPSSTPLQATKGSSDTSLTRMHHSAAPTAAIPPRRPKARAPSTWLPRHPRDYERPPSQQRCARGPQKERLRSSPAPDRLPGRRDRSGRASRSRRCVTSLRQRLDFPAPAHR